MAARHRKDPAREALRRLISRLNAASTRREDVPRGTSEYREADEATRRYRRILLDDNLFERYVREELDPREELDGRPESGRR